MKTGIVDREKLTIANKLLIVLHEVRDSWNYLPANTCHADHLAQSFSFPSLIDCIRIEFIKHKLLLID